eukprot:TRINITY_DN9032_c0_g1_i1.p1 TRINITY_DN9032_c0_g1~~TRINITY_DN9032_c0_g1_i1.p1  ORF type:complete len:524 (+),score=127.58 TRINITY_DN9032_c0_g1_i1:41-1612(+)
MSEEKVVGHPCPPGMPLSELPASEVLVFSVPCQCFSAKGSGRFKDRLLVITDAAMYVYKDISGKVCKLRAPLSILSSITVSRESDQFVVHIKDQYDERFNSPRKEEIIACLKKFHRAQTGKSLKLAKVMKGDLAGVTWTQLKAKFISRQEQFKLLTVLGADFTSSDVEDANPPEADVTQILKQAAANEKISLNSFEMLKVIGRGSFAKVMLVRKKDNGYLYAMKILKKNSTISRHQVEHTMTERKVFERADCPFVPKLRYALQTSTKLYLFTDFYKGGELFFHLRLKKRFSENEAKSMIAEVALALGHLHSMGILARAVKPENVLLDDMGHCSLTDFGLSKQLTAEVPEAKSFCSSSAEYAPPEIIKGEGQTKNGDWWSLGVMLYELVVGIPPFYSQNINEMYNKISSTGVLRFPPFLSMDCRDLIWMLLNRDQTLRLGSRNDVEDVKAHPWFEDIDWEKLAKKEVFPAFRPKVETRLDDTSAIDKIFTEEPVIDSPAGEDYPQEFANAFEGFEYGLVGETGE